MFVRLIWDYLRDDVPYFARFGRLPKATETYRSCYRPIITQAIAVRCTNSLYLRLMTTVGYRWPDMDLRAPYSVQGRSLQYHGRYVALWAGVFYCLS